MLGSIVRERALDEGVRIDAATEALLEPELRERDLAGGLGRLELGDRAMADPVRLHADPAGLERDQLVPADGLVAHAERA